MFGVILWSDPVKGSAVIWCEDQGDLAYFDPSYKQAVGATPIVPKRYQSGDLVQFETVSAKSQTYAINVQDIDPAAAEVLVQGVPRKSREMGKALGASRAPPETSDAPADVINFAEHRTVRRSFPFGRGLSLRG